MMSPAMVQLPPSSVASPVLGAGSVRSMKSPPPPISPRTPPTDTSSIRMVPKSPDSVRSGNSNSSVLTSPFSQQQHQDRPSLDTQLMQDLPPVPPAKSPSTSPVLAYRAPSYGLAHSENAQYQQQHGEHEQTILLSPILQKSLANPHSPAFLEEEHSESEHSVLTNPMSLTENNHQMTVLDESFPPRRQTPMGFQNLDAAAEPTGITGSQLRPQTLLSRKPSGARAPPPRRSAPSNDSTSSLGPSQPPETTHYYIDPVVPSSASNGALSSHTASPTDLTPRLPSSPSNSRVITRNRVGMDESAADALAALSFLEQDERSASPPQTQHQVNRSPPQSSARVVPQILEPDDGRAPSPQGSQYRSSFALSKQASERKARSQAQQAAHDEAVHKPGRPNGKQKSRQGSGGGGWNDSSDEEEDDEEEEDEDEDDEEDEGKEEDDERRPVSTDKNHGGQIAAPVGRNPILQNQMRNFSGPAMDSAEVQQPSMQQQYSQQFQQRPLRTLPQIPQVSRGRSPRR